MPHRFATTLICFSTLILWASPAAAELLWNDPADWASTVNVTSFATHAADLDRDGYPDVVEADYYGEISIYFSHGGNLSTSADWVSATGSRWFDLGLADIDGDGWIDIIGANEGGTQAKVFFNHGGGLGDMFSPTPDWASDILGSGCRLVQPMDVDDDGDMDLLVGCRNLGLLLNNGGALASSLSWSSNETVGWWPEPDLADFDNDGNMELVVPNLVDPIDGSFHTYVYRWNEGTLGFDFAWRSPPIGGNSGNRAVTHAYWLDFENDGDLDLVSSKTEVFINTNGSLAASPMLPFINANGSSFWTGGALYGMAVADYNRDNRTDVILTRHIGNSPGLNGDFFYYFENTGTNFVLRQNLFVPALIVRVQNTDYNADGRIDVLLTTFGQSMIYTYYRTDDPCFDPEATADEIAALAASSIALIKRANPPGAGGLANKLDGRDGVPSRVATAIDELLNGTIDPSAYCDRMSNAWDHLQAYRHQLQGKISNGQIPEPMATQLLNALEEMDNLILTLRDCFCEVD